MLSSVLTRLRGMKKSKRPYADIPDSAFPTFPPPTPQEILDHCTSYEALLKARKYAAPRGQDESPLCALYRIYEYIVLNCTTGMRNEIEFFWYSQCPVSSIPDPADPDPVRYAALACIPQILVNAYNRRIADGLPRNHRPIMSLDEIEELKALEKVFESVPDWTRHVPQLKDTFRIPHEKGEVLENLDDPRASPSFLAKNILVWEPHYYFV